MSAEVKARHPIQKTHEDRRSWQGGGGAIAVVDVGDPRIRVSKLYLLAIR